MDKRTKEYKQMMKNQEIEVVKEVKSPVFRAIVQINGGKIDGIAGNIADALLAATPQFYKTNAIIQVFDGERKAEKVFNVFRTKRLFTNKIFRDFMSKSFLMQLK